MSWSRVATPGEVVAAGDKITVKVLRMDEASGKISLGLTQLQDDPWNAVSTTLTVGQVVNGRVTRVAEFGAFVELAPGVEGLAHASTFPPTGRPDGWTTSVPVGTTAPFEILSIDLAQKRIGVALVEEGASRTARAATPGSISSGGAASGGVASSGVAPGSAAPNALAPGTIVTGKVERHERFGVFVFLSPGRTGLMPLAETGLERDADPRKAFPVGSEVEVVVLEADANGRRIRVSRKAVAEQREKAEMREYTERADAAPEASLGSLGDKLRDALKGR
jgi:small subunit ribosomal protein S1